MLRFFEGGAGLAAEGGHRTFDRESLRGSPALSGLRAGGEIIKRRVLTLFYQKKSNRVEEGEDDGEKQHLTPRALVLCKNCIE